MGAMFVVSYTYFADGRCWGRKDFGGAIRIAYGGRHHTGGCVIGALIFSFEIGAVGFGSPFYVARGGESWFNLAEGR